MGMSRCTAQGNVLLMFSDGTLMCVNVDYPRRPPWVLHSSQVGHAFVLTGQESVYRETLIGTGWRMDLQARTHSKINPHHEIRDIACNGTSAVWIGYGPAAIHTVW